MTIKIEGRYYLPVVENMNGNYFVDEYRKDVVDHVHVAYMAESHKEAIAVATAFLNEHGGGKGFYMGKCFRMDFAARENPTDSNGKDIES